MSVVGDKIRIHVTEKDIRKGRGHITGCAIDLAANRKIKVAPGFRVVSGTFSIEMYDPEDIAGTRVRETWDAVNPQRMGYFASQNDHGELANGGKRFSLTFKRMS